MPYANQRQFATASEVTSVSILSAASIMMSLQLLQCVASLWIHNLSETRRKINIPRGLTVIVNNQITAWQSLPLLLIHVLLHRGNCATLPAYSYAFNFRYAT